MRALGIAAVLTAVVTVYLPHVQRASFVYEDASVLENTVAAGWRGALMAGRGLTRETWLFIRTPRAAHALNLTLHLLVVALTAILMTQITHRPGLGLSVAAIVALHPLAVETVAYATSRAELIAAVGALIALVALTARRRWIMALMPCALLLAYAGKETGLVAVGLMPLVLWLRGSRRAARALGLGLLVAVGVACAVAPTTVAAVMASGTTARMPNLTAVSWALMQAEAVYRLVVMSVAPFWLSVNPDITGPSWAGVAALILLAGLLEVAWRCRLRAPMFFAGIVWCAVVSAPRFLVRTPLSPFNEHQWYLALPGVALVIVAGIEAVDARWRHAWEVA